MKKIILLSLVVSLTACSNLPKQPSNQEVWKAQKACQFYKDVHPEEDMSKNKDCKGFILEDNKMPE